MDISYEWLCLDGTIIRSNCHKKAKEEADKIGKVLYFNATTEQKDSFVLDWVNTTQEVLLVPISMSFGDVYQIEIVPPKCSLYDLDLDI